MALLKIVFVLALACASALGEPIHHHKGVQNETVFSSNTSTTVRVDGELVRSTKLELKVKREGNPGPRPRAADAAHIFELVNEHVASMQAMPHNAHARLRSQSYANLPLVSNVTGEISIQSGRPQPQGKIYINMSNLEYAKKPNGTLAK